MTEKSDDRNSARDLPSCVVQRGWHTDPERRLYFVPVPGMKKTDRTTLEQTLCKVIETAMDQPLLGAHGECKKSDGSDWEKPAPEPPCFWLRVIPQ